MFNLSHSCSAWGTDDLPRVLKAELEALPPGTLPLEHATTQGGQVESAPWTVTVLHCSATPETICARVGVFFSERVGGCNCADDPLCVNQYALLQLDIDRNTGATSARWIED